MSKYSEDESNSPTETNKTRVTSDRIARIACQIKIERSHTILLSKSTQNMQFDKHVHVPALLRIS